MRPGEDSTRTSGRPAATPPVAGSTVVALAEVTKRYGAVAAVDGVDLELRCGLIHGVLGENGAGKSTLMKLLIGLVLPDAGQISLRGEPVRITDPVAAAELGIGMVHQHFSLIGALTVWENVVLGDRSRLDAARARAQVTAVGERYGLRIDPDARVEDLTAGQRQRVELVKCLRSEPSVLILDEPTSVLTPQESRDLFDVLRVVTHDEGRAVVLVSHHLEEIRRATDEVTIMRAGRVVAHGPTIDFDDRSLAREMVGREVALRDIALLGATTAAVEKAKLDTAATAAPVVVARRGSDVTPALRLRDVSVRGGDGRRLLEGLDLDVWPGEIVGLAGVEGNGQAALGDLCSSILAVSGGVLEVAGVPVTCGRPGAMAAAGLGVVPEDRHRSGCVLDLSVAENLVLDLPEALARRGFLRHRALRAHAEALIAEYEISCPGPDAAMWQLSGGNQQRVVLARELSRRPAALVAAQPTRGLDVGAVEYVGNRLRAAAAEGTGVLLISTELEEILDLADRIVVIHAGRIVGGMDRHRVDLEELGLLMGGRTDDEAAA